MTSPSRPALTLMRPLPWVVMLPRMMALPVSLKLGLAKVIELKVADVRSFWVVVCVDPWKTRSSRLACEPEGAMPPNQLAPVAHLLLAPLPVQVKEAGAKRVSSCSRWREQVRLRMGLTFGRRDDFSQRDHEKKAMVN